MVSVVLILTCTALVVVPNGVVVVEVAVFPRVVICVV